MILGKNYGGDEAAYRKDVFISNLKAVHIHNYLESKGQKSFRMGTNEYSDMVKNSSNFSKLVYYSFYIQLILVIFK